VGLAERLAERLAGFRDAAGVLDVARASLSREGSAHSHTHGEVSPSCVWEGNLAV
jgi:hypothetical protein